MLGFENRDRMRKTPVSRASILIVDEAERVWKPLQRVFRDAKRLHFATNALQALEFFHRHPIHLVCLGVLLPDLNGIELLKKLKRADPSRPVIVASAAQDIKTAVDAMKAGALDFLPAPIGGEYIRTLAERVLAHQQVCFQAKSVHSPGNRGGGDGAVHSVCRIIDALSPVECHVLIFGGTGLLKKRIARIVHDRSKRTKGPYVAVNCAGMPARSLEGALFGCCRRKNGDMEAIRPGKIERAHGGSLFLDNVNYLSPDLQARLLRFIQHQEFEAIGSHRTVKADVRIIAASSQNLQILVGSRLFHKDLYASLNALPIDLALLQTRGRDIGLLLEHFLNQTAIYNGVRRKHFTTTARSTRMASDWPGNAREFERLLERLCNAHGDQMPRTFEPPGLPMPDGAPDLEGLELKKATRAFERRHIVAALRAFEGNRSLTARHLGIHRNTLLAKTKELGIDIG